MHFHPLIANADQALAFEPVMHFQSCISGDNLFSREQKSPNKCVSADPKLHAEFVSRPQKVLTTKKLRYRVPTDLGGHATTEKVTKDDANDLLDFSTAICEYVFVLNEKWERFQNRKKRVSAVGTPVTRRPYGRDRTRSNYGEIPIEFGYWNNTHLITK